VPIAVKRSPGRLAPHFGRAQTGRQSDAITIGDTSRNSPGYQLMARDSDDLPLMVSADFNGNGAVIPVARISTVVSGDDAVFISDVTPSVVAVGEAFSVSLRVEDQYWNPARDGRGAFRVSLNARPVGEINAPAGKYTGHLDGAKIAQEGGYKFEVTSADRRFRCFYPTTTDSKVKLKAPDFKTPKSGVSSEDVPRYVAAGRPQ
jgi:hypothetical protein